MYHTLLTSLENGILTLTINRPDKLNALNRTVFEELNTVLEQIEKDPLIRSVIITGAGQKAFVAGADIAEFNDLSQEEAMDMAKRGQDTFFRIENSAKPILAAVNGFALGGGCELAMSCHMRIASETARFGQPEVNLGLVPGYGGTQRLTKLIGKGRAIEYLITGNMIDATTALQLGLVNHVASPDELLTQSVSLLTLINSKAPIAVAKCIECANIADGGGPINYFKPGGNGIRNGYVAEVEAFGDCFATEDMKEGTNAFLAKRKPVFTGK